MNCHLCIWVSLFNLTLDVVIHKCLSVLKGFICMHVLLVKDICDFQFNNSNGFMGTQQLKVIVDSDSLSKDPVSGCVIEIDSLLSGCN